MECARRGVWDAAAARTLPHGIQSLTLCWMGEEMVLVKHHGRGKLHALDCAWVAGCDPAPGEYVARLRSDFPTDFPEHGCLGPAANRTQPSGRDRAAHDSFARAVKGRDGGQCVECGGTEGLVAHHIVPLMEGGTHEPDNGVTLCGKHHKTKHTTYKNKTHRSDGTRIVPKSTG